MHTSQFPLYGVSATSAAVRERAEALAARLRLPLLENVAGADGLVLRMTLDGLELVDPRPGAPGGVRVDFAALARRIGPIRGESVARAVGLRAGEPLTVIDATAGLGRDAFVLASLGATVRMLERAPAIAALLEDGLARARAEPTLAEAAARLSLTEGDAQELLPRLPAPDVIYLDPMYPEDGTKGQVKKDMQLLRQLLGPDPDFAPLFALALTRARRRVVVKRPRKAPPLDGRKPNHSLEGRSTRFDVYLPAPTGG